PAGWNYSLFLLSLNFIGINVFMKYYTADLVYPIAGPAIKNGIVAINAENVITGIHQPGEIDPALIESFKGSLIPGFVNAHCHLELSHMLGVIPQKTGLPK